MKVDVKEIDGVCTAVLEGRLDTISAEKCGKDLQPLFDNAARALALDCSKMDYISSSGLRIFLALRKEVGVKGGSLVLCGLCDDVRNVFDLTGFSKLFDIKD